MDLSRTIQISSTPEYIFRCLLSPNDLKEWWQCTAVVEARVAGVWALGWGVQEESLGHAMVITGFIQEIVPSSQLAIFIDPITINITLAGGEGGTSLTIEQNNYPDGQDAESSLETWVSAMEALKAHVEAAYPLASGGETKSLNASTRENPALVSSGRETGQKKTVNVKDNSLLFQSYPSAEEPAESDNILDSRGSKSGVYSLGGGQITDAVQDVPGAPPKAEGPTSEPEDGFQVLDDGGFPITNPWGVIKSWKKESGFGYVDHPELGDVMFDYDGCDFEPQAGDKVLLLKLKKTWNGKPKCKRIACPDKGSRVDK